MKIRNLISSVFGMVICLQVGVAGQIGLTFADAEEAVAALQKAASEKNTAQLRAIFGAEVESISNPDPVEATNEVAKVAQALGEFKKLVKAGEGRMILEYGNDHTQFPVP